MTNTDIRLRILVVDDNRPSADSLAMLLEGLGHEARVGYDGEGAMTEWEAFRPQVAFIDLRMPDEDGFAVAQRLRETDHSPNTFLVALSGYSPADHDPNWSKSAFDDFALKPLGLQQLQALLVRAAAR